jgi:hypothetical protein
MSTNPMRIALVACIMPALCIEAVAYGEFRQSQLTAADEVHRLALAELNRVAGPAIKKMETSSETRWFLQDLLNSKERMADLMLSGP